jgi:hypothetical protein
MDFIWIFHEEVPDTPLHFPDALPSAFQRLSGDELRNDRAFPWTVVTSRSFGMERCRSLPPVPGSVPHSEYPPWNNPYQKPYGFVAVPINCLGLSGLQ